MTPEEETALAIACEGGDQTAYKKLIEANFRLVIPLARRYEGRGAPLDDLVNAGNVGLVRAVRVFEPDGNLAFSEVARQYIEQAVSAAVA